MSKDSESEPKSSEGKRWEDLIFGTFEKLAQAPNRLKDPKETVGFAFDWVKGMRSEIQDKVREEISSRVAKLDFNQIAKRLGDHLAENYRLKITAEVQWVPKEKKKKAGLNEEAVEDLNIQFEKVRENEMDEHETP